jgi:hypothetical protein
MNFHRHFTLLGALPGAAIAEVVASGAHAAVFASRAESGTNLFVPYLYPIYTLFIPYLHPIYTLFTPYLYPTYTPFIPYLHPIYTPFIPYLHPIYTLFRHEPLRYAVFSHGDAHGAIAKHRA